MPQDPALGQQSKGRALSDAERAFANALERIYETGCHDFAEVAEKLNSAGAARPSGKDGPWTLAVFEEELKAINASHDAAHAAHGIGA
ncbi:recombinase-like helix-turn-helix domain-containing protein [Jannaschia sp. 2305UL9-9]|uniref:recombinase-like helix-turn-helix domain-containing protein n=1 Tax=Jannaschia sp. 2305UL9-9 TaxID=3121638 RepID=UPI00352802EF